MKRLFVLIVLLMTYVGFPSYAVSRTEVSVPQEPVNAGVVEGFYGGPWTPEFRHEVISLLKNLGLDTYVYAPKNDPFVGTPDWIMPYPQGQVDMLKAVMEHCAAENVRFIWTVRPDKDFRWQESDYRLLIGKFEMMYFIGVRSFAVIFDDVPYVDESEKARLLEMIDRDFISKRKGAMPLVTDFDRYCVPEEKGRAVLLDIYAYAGLGLERTLDVLLPEIKDAARTFIMNTSLACSAFGIEESAHLDLIGIDGYTREQYESLMSEFTDIEGLYDTLLEYNDGKFFAQLEPWIRELSMLGARCRRILECIASYNEGDIPGFWATYADNLMSVAETASFSRYPAGSERLQPYYENMMVELASAFNSKYRNRVGYRHMEYDGINAYVAPDEAESCHLIMNNPEGKEVIVRLSDNKGSYVAEFCTDQSYFEFELKENAVKVEIIGGIDIFEIIFVK
jgi:hypothetical protein